MKLKRALLIALVLWILQLVLGIARRVLAREKPRMCPACGYPTVIDLRRIPARKAEDPPTSYGQCKTCRTRYKHRGDGPLIPVSEEEWLRAMGILR